MFAGRKKSVSIKSAAVFLAVLLIISFIAVIVDRNIRANTIYVNGKAMILGVGQEYDYQAVNENLVRYKSNDEDIVTVDSKGVFRAVAKGTAVVKIGTSDVTVYVEDAPTGLHFSEAELSIGEGETYMPPLTVEGSELNTGFRFTSSDPSVIGVDSIGNVTGISQGSADVNVESYNGLKASAKINVLAAPQTVQYPVSEKVLYIGTEKYLKATVPSGSASKMIYTESDNTDVLKTEGAKLIPVSEGEANVIAETYNGKTATCRIVVSKAPFYIRTDLDPGKPMIALSFDDGPNAGTTNTVLDTLQQYGASATFFMVSNRLSKSGNADCAKRMVELGCQLGNHTYDHSHYGGDVTAQDISKGIEAIKAATGYSPTAFRPTGGYLSDVIKENASAPICLWNVDTNDWKYKDSEKLKNYVLYAADDGDIILMHDIYKTSAEAVQKFVPELTERGYQIVNIAELAYYKDTEMKNGQIYSSFK